MITKRKKVLIAATALLIGGALIAMGAYAAAGFNLAKLSTAGTWEQANLTLPSTSQEPYTSLVVHGDGYGIRLEPSNGTDFEVSYWKNSTRDVQIADAAGVLTVTAVDKPVFAFMQINLDFQDRSTVIKVPVSYAGSISVDSGSGNVDLSDIAGLSSLDVNITSGSASINRIVASDLSLGIASGNLAVDHLQADRVKAVATSGSVSLSNIEATDSIEVESSSGNHRLDTLSARRVIARTISGSITASGIDSSDTAIDIVSGNVNASLVGSASDYTVETSVASGTLNLPEGATNGSRRLSVRITSGRADISFNGSPSASSKHSPPSDETPVPPAGPAAPSAPAAPPTPPAPPAPAAPSAPPAPPAPAAPKAR